MSRYSFVGAKINKELRHENLRDRKKRKKYISQLRERLRSSQSGAEAQSVGSGTPKQSVRSRGLVSWEWDSKAVSPEQRVSQLGVGLQSSQSGAEGQSVRSETTNSQSGAEGLSVGSGTPK